MRLDHAYMGLWRTLARLSRVLRSLAAKALGFVDRRVWRRHLVSLRGAEWNTRRRCHTTVIHIDKISIILRSNDYF